tara:strand:- start:141 stop:1214 length:1074 start_codon:yes stop_codon:yes gene_type:complete
MFRNPLSSRLLGAAALAGCLFVASPAFAGPADDDPTGDEFTPSEDELDQELDESLQDEYEWVEEEEEPARPAPVPAPPPSVTHDRGIRLRLGGMAAIGWTGFHDIEISHRKNTRGGDTVVFDSEDGDQQGAFEFENSSGYYRAWFDIGSWVSLQGAYSHVSFKDANVLGTSQGATPGFVFGETAYQTGSVVEVSHTLRIADFDVALHPLHFDWLRLDVTLGARYVYWETTLDRRSGTFARERESLEALIPMIGLGISLRPVQPFEIFLRGRIGSIELERKEGSYRRRNGQREQIKPFKREQSSLEIDAGFSFTFDETIGLIVGARLDFLEIDRQTEDQHTRFEGTSSTLYAGLLLQF